MLHVAYYTVCCVSVAGKAVVSSMACCALNVVHSVSCVACQCARYVFDYVPHRPHLIPVKDDLYRSVVFPCLQPSFPSMRGSPGAMYADLIGVGLLALLNSC